MSHGRELTRTQVMIFGSAVILVPLFVAAQLVHAALTSDRVLHAVVLPAFVGLALGTILAVAGARREPGRRRRYADHPIVGCAIVVAAVAGSYTDVLPEWVESLIHGAILGFFLVLLAVVVRAWRHDADFRSRVSDALSSG